MNLHHFDIPLVTLLAFLLSACGSGDAEVVSHDKTTAIQLIDSLAIHETDDRFIGELVDADVELDPLRIYVADRKMRRVAVVTADGSIEQLIGSPGKGPGELGRPVFLSVEGERMVVAQQRWRGFSVFDTSGRTSTIFTCLMATGWEGTIFSRPQTDTCCRPPASTLEYRERWRFRQRHTRSQC